MLETARRSLHCRNLCKCLTADVSAETYRSLELLDSPLCFLLCSCCVCIHFICQMGGIYIIDLTFFIHGSRIHLSWNMVNPFYDVLMVVLWLLGMLCLSGLASALQAGKINVHKNYSRAWGNLMPEIIHLLLNNIPSGTKMYGIGTILWNSVKA